MKTITSILMIGLAGFLAIKNRYRILNLLLRSGLIRRMFVGSIFSLPGVRDKMMQSMFSGPVTR